jgi:hypothetical protein
MGTHSQAAPMAERIPTIVAIGCAIGTASLAMWVVARKPSFGPRTLRPSFALCVIAYGLLRGTGPLMKAVVDAAGPAVALFVVVMPVLGFAFWSAVVLTRALIMRVPHRG